MNILTDETRRFPTAIVSEHDVVQAEMTAYADEHGFPTIGPGVDGVLRILAHLADATRLFEFDSGFGYSATWFTEGVANNIELFLTEHDAHELDMAQEFPDRADLAGRTTSLEGDVLDLFEGVDGEFDLVLLGHQKYHYVEAFDPVSDHVAVGGAVVTDNVMCGPVSFGALIGWSEGRAEALDGADADTRGIAAFLDVVRADSRYETIAPPAGSDLVVSTRVE